MKIKLKNIGKIKETDIEIKGITVIAGENNSGKSTVGKVLYSVFNTFYNVEARVSLERIEIIGGLLERMYQKIFDSRKSLSRIHLARSAGWRMAKDIGDSLLGMNKEEMANTIFNIFSQDNSSTEEGDAYKKILNSKELEEIVNVKNIPENKIFERMFSKKIYTEFGGQINNIFNEKDGQVELVIQNRIVSILLKDNFVSNINENFSLNTEVIYIDDPFVVDEADSFMASTETHRGHLIDKLSLDRRSNNISEIIVERKISNILSVINDICGGTLAYKKNYGIGYKLYGSDKILDIKNVSVGLKTFIILKTLLIKSVIQDNGVVILDEPEIHLHPKWQLIFAELIVMLQKEFNLHILLNTHSPYFLNAIQVYAAKHTISNKCKYYLSENRDDYSEINDVSNDIDKIYKKLAEPFQKLENQKYEP